MTKTIKIWAFNNTTAIRNVHYCFYTVTYYSIQRYQMILHGRRLLKVGVSQAQNSVLEHIKTTSFFTMSLDSVASPFKNDLNYTLKPLLQNVIFQLTPTPRINSVLTLKRVS